MVIQYNDVLHVIGVLGDDCGVQVTVRESVKGGLITGSIASVGGVILGPPGLAIGGAIGGIIATIWAGNTFRPVSQVIVEMRDSDKQRLAAAVQNIVSNLDAGDAMTLLALIQGNELLKARVMTEMLGFLRNQMSYSVNSAGEW